MFRGTRTINLDIKGRLTIPAVYRELVRQQETDRLVCTIDYDIDKNGRVLLSKPLHQDAGLDKN